RIRLLLDYGLTKLADAAEDREVRLDAQAGPPLPPRPRETHARPGPAAPATLAGLRPPPSAPPGTVLLLARHGAVQRQADRADLNPQVASVSLGVDGFDPFDSWNTLRDRGDVHQELPQAFALDGNRALLCEGHCVSRATARAASHACVSAR